MTWMRLYLGRGILISTRTLPVSSLGPPSSSIAASSPDESTSQTSQPASAAFSSSARDLRRIQKSLRARRAPLQDPKRFPRSRP